MVTTSQHTNTLGPFPLNTDQVIGMGAWAIGGDYGGINERDALQTIAAAVAAGIGYIDTADAYGYGLSEERLGRALHHTQAQIQISTKVGNWGRRLGHPLPFSHWSHMVACCDASLHRLRREHIDCYLIHEANPAHPDVYDEAFERLLRQGKILSTGISTNNVHALKKLQHVDVCQCDYSLINRRAESDLLPYCQEQGIQVVARGVLHRGLLSGKFDASSTFTDFPRQQIFANRESYMHKLKLLDNLRTLLRPDRQLADIAIAFALRHPAVSLVIPGMKTVAQVQANMAAAHTQLSDSEWNRLLTLTD